MDKIAAAMPSVARELGSAVAYVKFASEQPAAMRNWLLARMNPRLIELVNEFQAASAQ